MIFVVMTRLSFCRSLAKSINDFFNQMRDSRNRIADDVYAFTFFIDFSNIVVIIFGFSVFCVSVFMKIFSCCTERNETEQLFQRL